MPTGPEEPCQDVRRVHVVIHDEHPTGPRGVRLDGSGPFGGGPRLADRVVSPDREAHEELAALPHPGAVDGHAAPVELDQATDQGQADAEPSLAAVERAV